MIRDGLEMQEEMEEEIERLEDILSEYRMAGLMPEDQVRLDIRFRRDQDLAIGSSLP
jgi:hypothetical protein